MDVLYLSNNQFAEIPKELKSLRSLSRLSLRSNGIRVVDCDVLPDGLVHLILSDNLVERFIGACDFKLRNVKKLMLARNRLGDEFVRDLKNGLPNLLLIRLSQNRLAQFPYRVFENSPKVKWASFGGNSFTPIPDVMEMARNSKLPIHNKKELKCSKNVVGAGTSGNVLLCSGNLVFKEFKKKSSDGSFVYEIAATLALPRHRGLMSPEGIVVENDMITGMMFPYHEALQAGLPPDIFRTADDIFPPEKQHQYSASRVYDALRRTACALAAMHDAGVVHMDLYAHNTLLSETECLTIDMGAAVMKWDNDVENGFELLKASDVRAFRVLIRDFVREISQNPEQGNLIRFESFANKVTSAREICEQFGEA